MRRAFLLAAILAALLLAARWDGPGPTPAEHCGPINCLVGQRCINGVCQAWPPPP